MAFLELVYVLHFDAGPQPRFETYHALKHGLGRPVPHLWPSIHMQRMRSSYESLHREGHLR